MLGQAHTLRRRLLPLALVAGAVPIALLAKADVGGADPSQSAAALRALDAQLEAKQRSAVLGVYALDRQLASAHGRLEALGARARELRAQRAVLGKELAVAKSGSRVAQRRLDDRLRMLYERRPVTTVEVLLGAHSLDDALDELDNLSSASAQSEAVLSEVHAARRHLSAVGRGLAARSAALASATRSEQRTEAALEATRARRAGYLASIEQQRRLTEHQVAVLVARARAAAARSAALERSTRVTDDATPGVSFVADTAPPAAAPPTPGARELTVTATGYALSGSTATGLPVGWGVAAVDPSTIPLGTHMYVPGYGEAVAADTGGAVSGADIDLWFPTAAQASAWGRRTVRVEIR